MRYGLLCIVSHLHIMRPWPARLPVRRYLLRRAEDAPVLASRPHAMPRISKQQPYMSGLPEDGKRASRKCRDILNILFYAVIISEARLAYISLSVAYRRADAFRHSPHACRMGDEY